MKILVLGGTRFLGRHVVQAAIDRGHDVTLFNRGQSDRDCFPQVTTLIGDRTCDIDKLAGDRWDAALDTSGHTPAEVIATADGLSGKVGHYTYVSTASVLAMPLMPGADEMAPVCLLPEGASRSEVTPETYGAIKAECERIVSTGFDGRSCIVRPGLVVGPEDPSDRFTYWLRRIKFGGDVLVPRPDQRVQFIDVRDLATFILRSAEDGNEGTFLATGPAEPLTVGEFLSACQRELDCKAFFTCTSDEFLLEHGVEPFEELPLWVPRELEGFMSLDCSKARSKGLFCRPLAETIADTFQWDMHRPWDVTVNAGFTLDREAELLEAWMARVAVAV